MLGKNIYNVSIYQEKINKAKTIKNNAIAILATYPLGFIVFPIVITLVGLIAPINKVTYIAISVIIFCFGLILSLYAFIQSIIVIVKIGTTDGLDNNLNEDKSLYGILTLVFMFVFILIFIGPILGIVGYYKVKNKLTKIEQEKENNTQVLESSS